MNPYQYGANDPIKYIDVNGDSLWIQTGKNSRALYQDGQVLNADGTQYSGRGTKTDKNGNIVLKGFLKSTVANLNKISGGNVGNSIVDEIQGSTSSITITNSTQGNRIKIKSGKASVEFNPTSTQGGMNEDGNKNRPSFIGLAHELAHGVDALRGTISKTVQSGNSVNNAEIFASHIENQIRAENFLPLRTHYNSQQLLKNGVSIHNNYDYRRLTRVNKIGLPSLVPANLPKPTLKRIAIK